MKTIIKLQICTLAVFAASCSSDDAIKPPSLTQNSSNIRTENEAKEYAQGIADACFEASRMAPIQSVGKVHTVLNASYRSKSDTLLYIVDYTDNNGFAIISAALTGEPVLAYTDKGSYDEKSDNPGLSLYIEQAKAYAAGKIPITDSIGEIGLTPDPSRPISVIETIYPRISVEWGQRYPEGIFCPNGISGCVQTANAQIFSFLEKPSSLSLTYPEKDIDIISIDWSNLKKHSKSSSYKLNSTHYLICEASKENHNNLARLCRELGHRAEAIYTNNSTSSHPSPGMIQQLTNCSVSELKNLTDYPELFSYLEKSNSVACIQGRNPETGAGHVWLCDGAQQIVTTQRVPDCYGSYETITKTTTYFHFNWGLNGDGNGYFFAGVFDPAKGNKEPISRTNYNSNVKYFLIRK